jgi:hypothetical protein
MTPSGLMTPQTGSLMTDESGIPIDSDGNQIGLGISLSLEKTPSFSNKVETEIARRQAYPPRSGSAAERSPSPNTMNALNELDPAFNRAVEGLRLASESGDADDESKPAKKKQGGKKKGKKGRKH